MNQIENNNITPDSKKSNFITLVSVIFILIGSVKSCGSTLSTISYFSIYSDLFNELFSSANSTVEVYETIFNYAWILFLMDWLYSCALLMGAIGTLKRKNWGRIIFTYVLLISVVYLVSIPIILHVLQFVFEISYDIERYIEFQIYVVSFVLIFSSLLVWIIFKLNSKKNKLEFT